MEPHTFRIELSLFTRPPVLLGVWFAGIFAAHKSPSHRLLSGAWGVCWGIGDVLRFKRRNFTNPVAPNPLATKSLI